jgi:hypothetical protein
MARSKYELLTVEQYEAARGKGDYDKGVLTTSLSTWREFCKEAARFRTCRDYVWRGQRKHGDGWTLKSAYDREYNDENREARLEQHRKEFARPMERLFGPLGEDELWALGQHHGLCTPLLDWTESPFVAAYFTFEEVANTRERVVYALNRDINRWFRVRREDKFIKFPLIPPRWNIRFVAQKGVFTKALKGEDVKTRIQKCYHETNHRNRIILAELLIPDSSRDEFLSELNRMEINHASLFPNIDSIAESCNQKLGDSRATLISCAPRPPMPTAYPFPPVPHERQ